jgi:hypothetical protein
LSDEWERVSDDRVGVENKAGEDVKSRWHFQATARL